MTVFLLIRHALHSLGGQTIAGRLADVHLSEEGRAQAEGLATRLSGVPIKAIYCSPLDRTCETARAIGAKCGCQPLVAEEVNELDFGEWAGQKLDELKPLERWRQFNAFRSGTRPPSGELMLETQARIVAFMMRLREQYPDDVVAIVSHGDVIRSAVAYFLGMPLDLFQRFEISPASVTVVAVSDYGPWVLCVNHTGDLPQLPS
jgi:probable phosphomutase (TIGR03848 family)